MKVVILAGGFGTRLAEETVTKPKPMIEIGGKPILWHIMKIYSYYGFNEFIICLGYKGYIIKEFFANYFLHQSNVTFNLIDNKIEIHSNETEPWIVTLINTGENTMTGGRIKRIKDYVGGETFLLTYGDGVANINISESINFHKKNGKLLTVTAVQPSGRFGALHLSENNDLVEEFLEKPKGDGSWINGGFFVCEPGIFDFIIGDETVFENEPLERIAASGQLTAFKHLGFWKPMDTLRDKLELEKNWERNLAEWKIW
ncbi:MAG: glucose-1-phosphate cytidylyltransferase [Cytophagaceae bacterium]|jgi:glucose-1-phosphate cytidylyltransferase|nr:glucose-1-phosphate cytidylyltransferase [Cytophagaceae bacterium]